jgi:uncharacterized DUF497 family protein
LVTRKIGRDHASVLAPVVDGSPLWQRERRTMIIYGKFEWDVREAARNAAKNGVRFTEAASIFGDPNCTISADGGSNAQAIGLSDRGRPVVVAHQNGLRIRILSAHVRKPEEAVEPKPESKHEMEARPAVKPARQGSWRAAAQAANAKPR